MTYEENLQIELKEFLVYSENKGSLEEDILYGKMYDNLDILKSLEKNILKYLPKYISGWNNTDLELSYGELYFGITDDGKIIGIPYDGILTETVVRDMLDKIRYKLLGSNISNILDNIKIDLIKVNPEKIDLIKEYEKEVSKYDSLIERHKVQVNKYLLWHSEIMEWNCKIIDILNIEEKREIFLKWVREYCNSSNKKDIIKEIEEWEYKEDFGYYVTGVKDDSNLMVHWLCLFKDIKFASRTEKPHIPIIRIPNWLKFYNRPYYMNYHISKINPNVNFYLLKFTIPNKKLEIFVKKNKKIIRYKRVINSSGPSSIPLVTIVTIEK